MSALFSFPSKYSFLTGPAPFACLVVVCIAAVSVFAQEDSSYVVHSNQEIRVTDLPVLTASSMNKSAALATALEIVVHDKIMCCGKDSAFADAVFADPQNLKELSPRLQGRHVLGDGLPVMVKADYVPQNAITPELMIGSLLERRALLFEWKSHFYVMYGAIFDEILYTDGRRQLAVHRLSLLDPRFSDQRRETEFNRDADDWGKVQGLLTLAIARQ
jgi:hypothetical protein